MFVRIVEAKSIAAAAETLGIAKSAASRRLADLESRLGVTLLQRTTRTSSLTDAGALYFERAKSLLNEVEDMNAQLANEEGALKGQLRFSAPLSFGNRHLGPVLHAFALHHPDLQLQIDFADQFVDLVEGGFDLALRIGALDDSTLKARRLCEIRMLICASPEYLQTYGEPKYPDELRQHRLLRYDNQPGSSWSFQHEDEAKVTVPVDGAHVANNGDFLLDFAIRGQGIVVTPSFIGSEAVCAGKLQCLLDGWQLPSTSAHIVYPSTKFLPARARALIDFLVKYFGEEPSWDLALANHW